MLLKTIWLDWPFLTPFAWDENKTNFTWTSGQMSTQGQLIDHFWFLLKAITYIFLAAACALSIILFPVAMYFLMLAAVHTIVAIVGIALDIGWLLFKIVLTPFAAIIDLLQYVMVKSDQPENRVEPQASILIKAIPHMLHEFSEGQNIFLDSAKSAEVPNIQQFSLEDPVSLTEIQQPVLVVSREEQGLPSEKVIRDFEDYKREKSHATVKYISPFSRRDIVAVYPLISLKLWRQYYPDIFPGTTDTADPQGNQINLDLLMAFKLWVKEHEGQHVSSLPTIDDLTHYRPLAFAPEVGEEQGMINIISSSCLFFSCCKQQPDDVLGQCEQEWVKQHLATPGL